MNRGLRKLIEAKREAQITRAARDLLDGVETGQLKAELEQIEVYDKLLSAHDRKRSREWFWPAMVASLCFVIAGIVWSVKVPRTEISLALETDTLTATLAKAWQIEDAFHSPRMHFERLSKIQGPNLDLAINQGSGDAWFDIEGGELALQTLQVSEQAGVEIDAEKDAVNIYINRGRVSGKVTAMGKIKVTAGPRAGETSVRKRYEVDVPETVEFGVDYTQSVPSKITVRSPANWILPRMQAIEIGFAREELTGAGERSILPGVKSGTIRFDDTAWAVLQLREGDMVGLHHTELAAANVRAGNDLMHVSVKAVADVTVGDVQNRRRVAPSYLEYLYQNKSLGLLWGAIVFLWGVIWGIRKAMSS